MAERTGGTDPPGAAGVPDVASRAGAVAEGRAQVLVVDGANVVGSVPDGWWRDRAGAAARLHAGLVAAEVPWGDVVLVLEGKARAGVSECVSGRVRTVHAPGEGDDEIVDRCRDLAGEGRAVAVATTDRGLLDRLAPFVVQVVGPRRLRELL